MKFKCCRRRLHNVSSQVNVAADEEKFFFSFFFSFPLAHKVVVRDRSRSRGGGDAREEPAQEVIFKSRKVDGDEGQVPERSLLEHDYPQRWREISRFDRSVDDAHLFFSFFLGGGGGVPLFMKQ